MRKIIPALTALMVISLSACKTLKKPAALDISETVLDSFWSKQYAFQNLELRGKASVTASGKTNSVSVHIKMSRDSMIWGRFALLGFDLARVYVTPERFYFVDYINNTYLDYPTNYLNGYIGFTPSIRQLQDLLLGNAPFDRESYDFLIEVMKLRAQKGEATNELDINTQYRTNNSSFTTSDTTQRAYIAYDKYELENANLMPKSVTINLLTKQEHINCALNYQYINANPNINVSFKIPDGFRRL